MRSVSLWRRVLSHGVNMIYKGLLGISFTSTSSLFRLYRTAALKKLDLKSVNFDINAEILLKILKNGGRAVEVPVTLTVRRYGQSKINTLREIKNHLKIFTAIFRWRTGL
jgi:dolichol-phosphate mannosyltransferase